MEKSLQEMSQQEMIEFMNGANVPRVIPLDLSDNPEVKHIHMHTDTRQENRTVEDWINLMNSEECLNNGVVDLSK